MKKKWIWLSIFLSTVALGNHTPASQIVERPKLISFSQAVPKPVPIPKALLEEPVETTTTTTTIPEPTTTVPKKVKAPTPETVPVQEAQPQAPVDTACGPYKMSVSEAHACWDGLIGQYDWPFTTAFNTMYCESTGQYNAKNGSGATGLFQVLGGPIDPAANVAAAYSMWQERGWQPWVCKG